MFRCKACGAMNQIKAVAVSVPTCGRCTKVLDRTGTPQEVDGASLEQVVRSSAVPVLVDFWGPRSEPSRVEEPIVEELARQRAGKLLALKVNTDAYPATAASHHVQRTPTLVLYVRGLEVARKTGPVPKDQLRSWIFEATMGAA